MYMYSRQIGVAISCSQSARCCTIGKVGWGEATVRVQWYGMDGKMNRLVVRIIMEYEYSQHDVKWASLVCEQFRVSSIS